MKAFFMPQLALPLNIQNLLSNFRQYLLIQRDRDSATAAAYVYDALVYIAFYMQFHDTQLTSFDISPELVAAYYEDLRQKPIRRTTIQRRLIGLNRFWKYCYKVKFVASPPVALDDMDIVLKVKRNPCHPLAPNEFAKTLEDSRNELQQIF
jgi:site-specific recombinase XerD